MAPSSVQCVRPQRVPIEERQVHPFFKRPIFLAAIRTFWEIQVSAARVSDPDSRPAALKGL